MDKSKNNGKAIRRNNRGTELIWEGKYDEKGNLNLPERVSLPFQVVETVNESKTDREKTQMSFLSGKKDPGPWRNKLVWGDNLLVMSSLLEEFAGKVDLIYIDPPFATGADFSYKAKVGDAEVVKEPSIIEEIAYRDTWGKGASSYLQMMYERLLIMRDLLAEAGSIFIHCDWHVSGLVHVLCDELFGSDAFRNEIVWCYHRFGIGNQQQFTRAHDTVYWYSKGPTWKFNLDLVRVPYSEKTKANFVPGATGSGFGAGQLNEQGKIPEDYMIIAPAYKSLNEVLPYPTQKPEALLEKLVLATTDTGDLVADFFCGSGTAGAVAQKLGRRWIMCDLSRFAIQTARKRLLEIEDCSPFEVLNLGRYERQYWQASIVAGKTIEQRIDEYLNFILKLYKAEPLTGFSRLHGRKAGRLVHIGAVDAPITLLEIEETVEETEKAGQRKLDILGWEFAFGVDAEVIKQQKARGIDVRLLHIPREVMDKRIAESAQVDFYDLGALEPEVHRDKNKVQVEIKYFFIPNLDLVKEEEVRAKIKKWQDYIDYWAIDWDFKEDTFHNQWQDYRTRKDPSLTLKSDWHTYESPGKYQIVVKVIDVFGNDTTRLLEVEI